MHTNVGRLHVPARICTKEYGALPAHRPTRAELAPTAIPLCLLSCRVISLLLCASLITVQKLYKQPQRSVG
jgi:hypothetical protein